MYSINPAWPSLKESVSSVTRKRGGVRQEPTVNRDPSGRNPYDVAVARNDWFQEWNGTIGTGEPSDAVATFSR